MKKLWDDFGSLYNRISNFNLTATEAKAWIDLFCSLQGVPSGYTISRITPYMHLIPYHLPFSVQKHGKGVGKNNDDAERILLKTISTQKVGSGTSSSTKGRKQLT